MSSFLPPSDGVREHTARYAILGNGLLYWILGWAIASTLPAHNLHWFVALLTGPIAWLAWAWGHWLGWRSAAWWLAWAQMAVVAVLAWHQEADQSTVLLNMVVVVALCGWVLGLKAALYMSAVSMVLVAVLVQQGYMAMAQWVGLVYTLCFFLGVAHLGRQRYERQLRKQQTALDALQAHKRQMTLLYQAVEQSPACVLIVDREGCVRYANQTFERYSGYTRDEVIGRRSVEVAANGLTEAEHKALRETLGAGEIWRGMLQNQSKDGSILTESVSISPVYEGGQLTGFVEIKQDVSERLQAEEHIAQLQNFDGLTQLPNRYALIKRLEKLLLQSRLLHRLPGSTQPNWHAMLLVDVDRFKKFNDARGTAWTDALLQAVALRLRTLVPENAFVARTTADQFAVVLEHAASNRQNARVQAYVLANELQAALDAVEVHYEGAERVPISCGMGFTVFPFVEPGLQSDATEHIMRRCSVALNQAKSQGMGKVHAYSEALAESAQRRLQLESGLHAALAQGQMRLYVQHQVDMFGKVIGMEALVRWQHPQEGLISPGEFIPIAEESGLIVPLGDWVLEQVCQLLQHPRVRVDGYKISANVSALQFREPDFVPKLTALLQRTGIDTQRLVLEVTESLLLSDVDAIVEKMVALRALGVQFALDDFGTGYSSLSYLMRLPIQELKLDQSFIRTLQPDAPSGALVQALLMVAKSQKLRVVAEGVEERAQAQLLQAWEPSILCQGYLFSKPIPIEQWLQDPSRLAVSGVTEP